MVINGSSTGLFAGPMQALLAVPRLGNVRLRLHFLRRGTSGGFEGESSFYVKGSDAHYVDGTHQLSGNIYAGVPIISSKKDPPQGTSIDLGSGKGVVADDFIGIKLGVGAMFMLGGEYNIEIGFRSKR